MSGNVIEDHEKFTKADIELMQDLMSGKTEAPNDFVAYKIEQLGKLRDERMGILKGLEHIRQQQATLSDRLVRVEGMGEQAQEDILHWLKTAQE